MNIGWNFRREHLRPQQRSHYVITGGGDQPNVVPSAASVWYYFRELDYPHIKQMREIGDTIAQGAAMMTDTTVTSRVLGSAWPLHFNRPVAEAMDENIKHVGLPHWSESDQALAKAVQRELKMPEVGLESKLKPIKGPVTEDGRTKGGSDDIGDVSWNVPTVTLQYPSNLPSLPGHHWSNAITMATPVAHKGVTAGAKVLAMTMVDLLTQPALVRQAWDYFRDVQTKEIKYQPLISGRISRQSGPTRGPWTSSARKCGDFTIILRSMRHISINWASAIPTTGAVRPRCEPEGSRGHTARSVQRQSVVHRCTQPYCTVSNSMDNGSCLSTLAQ